MVDSNAAAPLLGQGSTLSFCSVQIGVNICTDLSAVSAEMKDEHSSNRMNHTELMNTLRVG